MSSPPNRFLERPEWLFLLISTLSGLMLCFLIPPLGGGKEVFDFQRAVTIAYGYIPIEKAQVPSGFGAFIDAGNRFFHEGLQPPFSYSAETWRSMAAIALDPSHSATLVPSPLTVNHPFCFLPQALAMRLGAIFTASPMVLLYLARLAGLLAAIALTFTAIRIMPSHRLGLCALALLPPITFSRSCVDSDQVTNGLAFLFVACTLREVVRPGLLRGRSFALLCLLGFTIAQCKNVYLMLPLLAAAIPPARFASRTHRFAAVALIALPGICASLWWMMFVKHGYLAGMTYRTWGGEVDPDRQMAFVLHHPFSYLAIVLRTLFLTPFFAESLIGIMAVFGPPVTLAAPVFLLLIMLMFAVIASDTTVHVRYGGREAGVAATLFVLFLGVSLTCLYAQWMGLGAPVIQGFQGRYLYPLLPLALIFARPLTNAPRRLAATGIVLLALLGHGAMIRLVMQTYY